ncbi:MAG: lipid-A-disaccharide synthase N-terminal domain-containing protein [Phycisphaerae bacterium]|jgi:lipid-A-disaccharide synthase-like uncharacterized protein
MRASLLLALAAVVFFSSSAAPAQPPAPAQEPNVQALQAQIKQQELTISRLEARVGVPSGLLAWGWFLVGMIGEGVFFMRFVVQWWASERKKRTVVPMAFWHLSLIGTGLVLAYALFVQNLVFILAYSLNVFLYVRNLVIARRTPAAVHSDD